MSSWVRGGEDGDQGPKMRFSRGRGVGVGGVGGWGLGSLEEPRGLGTRRKLPDRCQSCLQDTLHTH